VLISFGSKNIITNGKNIIITCQNTEPNINMDLKQKKTNAEVIAFNATINDLITDIFISSYFGNLCWNPGSITNNCRITQERRHE